MIITKTPLRISFTGGGTDLPAFIKMDMVQLLAQQLINTFILR